MRSTRCPKCGQALLGSNQGVHGWQDTAIITHGEEKPLKKLALLMAGCRVTFRQEEEVTNVSTPQSGHGG